MTDKNVNLFLLITGIATVLVGTLFIFTLSWPIWAKGMIGAYCVFGSIYFVRSYLRSI